MVDKMCDILAGAYIDQGRLKAAFQTVYDACGICELTVWLASQKKVSTFHINDALNMEIKVGFIYVKMDGERH